MSAEDPSYHQQNQVAVNPPPQAQGVAGQDGAPVLQEESTTQKIFGTIKSVAMRALIFYLIMQFFKGKQESPGTSDGAVAVSKPMRGPATNLFQDGMAFDMYVFVSEQQEFGEFHIPETLVWKKEGLIYGNWEQGPNEDSIFEFATQIPVSERVQNNGSLYIHTFIVREGMSPDPSAGKGMFSKKWTTYKTQRLNKFMKMKYKKTANLLTGATEQSEEDQVKAAAGLTEIISHWHPNLTLNVVFDHTPWIPGQVPPPLDEFVEFTPSLQEYKPVLWLNDYWNLNKDYTPINSTTSTLNLTLTIQPLSMFKWQMYSAQQLRNRFNVLGNLMGEQEEDQDQDSVKEAFLETNIYLLVLTFVISIVHSVFEFLAFKNDIQFWNKKKSVEGLSVRSVFFNVFQNLIVVLYVFDSDTNTVIRISCFVGLAIEIWKVTKVQDVSFDFENKILGIFPRIKLDDKKDYKDSGTKEFDRMAFRYLGMAFFPLALCYCIYSVIYNEHKSWYSFVLGSCYGFLLTFGFIMMTPQLFINYKLKSVAHLPWRMMTYKALNTFIDDIFAFVIKMPTMYRLGCFRDDIVFFIFLYQRYIYKEDKSRVNEFGYSADMLDEGNNPKQDAITGEIEAEESPLALTAENTTETKQDNSAETKTEIKQDSSDSGAWKNSQKQKSKKSKKTD
eukprot:GFUD01011581.1.p1 GENE.GFUD01011581.1~~GFUD01011581.1.p1  ORF type:complete len:671 (-),score=212.77 GFUD01011581.1:523-2535(-)